MSVAYARHCAAWIRSITSRAHQPKDDKGIYSRLILKVRAPLHRLQKMLVLSGLSISVTSGRTGPLHFRFIKPRGLQKSIFAEVAFHTRSFVHLLYSGPKTLLQTISQPSFIHFHFSFPFLVKDG